MYYLDSTNKLLIFIGWWASYPPFFKGNLEKKPNLNGRFVKKFITVSLVLVFQIVLSYRF